MSRRSPSKSQLSRSLSEVLSGLSPAAARSLGLLDCMGCAMAPFETVADAVRILGLDPKALCEGLEAKAGRR